MTHDHTFLLQPGKWEGEGTVGFSSSNDKMYFITNWEVAALVEDRIKSRQQVKMEDADEMILNKFSLEVSEDKTFTITLDNDLIGQVEGRGIIDKKTIAWEFIGEGGVQGFELYERQAGGEYSFHAEYASPDQFRTIIDGRIRPVR